MEPAIILGETGKLLTLRKSVVLDSGSDPLLGLTEVINEFIGRLVLS